MNYLINAIISILIFEILFLMHRRFFVKYLNDALGLKIEFYKKVTNSKHFFDVDEEYESKVRKAVTEAGVFRLEMSQLKEKVEDFEEQLKEVKDSFWELKEIYDNFDAEKIEKTKKIINNINKMFEESEEKNV